MLSLKKVLEEKGNKVIVYSMEHPQNYKNEYSNYFVSYINYADMARNKSLSSGLKVLLRSIYSFEAKRKIEKLIEKEKPDIAHINNIRQHVTTSILSVLRKYKIPIVWTLHDYQLICPNISFLANGRICEKCKKRKYYWPSIVKCKKQSLLASTMAAIEHSFQMFTRVYDMVDVFICPSKFLQDKFIEYSFYEDKLALLNHFIDVDWNTAGETQGDYILYIGRLSEEKGVMTLIDAASKVSPCKLKIVGDGPLKEKLVLYAETKGNNCKIEFLGHKGHREVIDIIKKCKFLVIPSEWYEVTGLTIFEAYACGKPVIGSRIGGIPEFIKDNETGLTFHPGDVDDLSSKIEYFEKNSDEIIAMGENGRSYIKTELNAVIHYDGLMGIYRKAMNSIQ